MNITEQLIQSWLDSEQNQKDFIGWDFSYLKGKYEQEPLPWSYYSHVTEHLKPTHQLLDMGTGGGELLQSFEHPLSLTSVTEGWKKNYHYLIKQLKPKGVNVQFVKEDDHLNFPDDSFDIVLNSHESFSINEVRRVLKPNGWFITQQVGDLNGLTLSSKLIPDFTVDSFNLHLSTVVSKLRAAGFKVLYQNEAYPAQRFFDMDGLIYYAKTISWEFPGFSVETHLPQLGALQEELERNGFIYNQEHRFIVAVQLN